MRQCGLFACGTRGVSPMAVVLAFTVALLGLRGTAAAQGNSNPLPGRGPVVLDGELEVIYEDDDARGRTRLLYFLNADDRRIPLLFSDGMAPDLPTGAAVRVRGNLADGTVTTTSTSVTVMAASASRTIGSQDVLVILFNFSNNTAQPFSASTIASVNDQVKSYYLENTFNQTTLSLTVTGWYTIAATNSGCDYTTWSSQAETKATNAGFNLSAYDRLVFAFPSASGCGWTGMANVGGPRSWINGSYVLRTVAHEQGHNFGDHHSKAKKCDITGCTTVEYGDDRDIMGMSGVVGHMNAFQKERLGWLNYGTSPTVPTVSSSGDYWLDTYETVLGTTKAIRIWNPVSGGYYYVESRAKIGFDGTVTSGVTLHSAVSGISYQIDLAPTTSTFDSTLDVGQVFTDASIGLTVETLSADTGGAQVRVTLVTAPCIANPPNVAMAASSALKYTVTVTNTNGSTCAPSAFTAAASVPQGWSATFSPSSLPTLAPGASTSTVLTLAAPSGTESTFSFTVTATDAGSGLSASVPGSVVLVTNLSVTASASLSGSGNNRAASIVVTAKAGTAPASGAAIVAVVTNPKGVASTLYATANSAGTATLKFPVKQRDPSGVYQVVATATGNGGTGQATTSFIVP